MVDFKGNLTFTSYIPVEDGKEHVYQDDSKTTSILRKEKVLLKLITSTTYIYKHLVSRECATCVHYYS